MGPNVALDISGIKDGTTNTMLIGELLAQASPTRIAAACGRWGRPAQLALLARLWRRR